MLPNVSLTPGAVFSDAFLQHGIQSFTEACHFVRQLPYGRNADKTHPLAVLHEGKGTCSTKHALLKNLANEIGFSEVLLYTGIFRMNPANTPRIAEVLSRHNLSYIPEAHCYLRYNGTVYDFTFPGVFATPFLAELMDEIEITPAQITDYKIAYHRRFLKNWLDTEPNGYSPDEIWKIREACIQALG